MRAFRVAYDGRPFSGFQRQPDVRTVEGELFAALRRLDVLGDDEAKPEGYAAAGRTDAGVSALAQTVAFECPDWLTPRAFNSELPGSICAWASTDVRSEFHATHDARAREYRYNLYAPNIDDDRARMALGELCGKHDFHNLTPDDENTVRDLYGRVERDGDFLVFDLRSSGFCRELVRRLITLIRDVASDAAPFDRIDLLLGEEPVDGPEGVGPAPAYPLVLVDAVYDVDFTVDPDAAADARDRFEERRVEHATLARVADTVASGVQ